MSACDWPPPGRFGPGRRKETTWRLDGGLLAALPNGGAYGGLGGGLHRGAIRHHVCAEVGRMAPGEALLDTIVRVDTAMGETDLCGP